LWGPLRYFVVVPVPPVPPVAPLLPLPEIGEAAPTGTAATARDIAGCPSLAIAPGASNVS